MLEVVRRSRYSDAPAEGRCLGRSVDTEERIALVAATWTATQRLHPGNVAWHGSGCDGAPSVDEAIEGAGWFAEVANPRHTPLGGSTGVPAAFSSNPSAPRRSTSARGCPVVSAGPS